jgi:hypothetical protein
MEASITLTRKSGKTQKFAPEDNTIAWCVLKRRPRQYAPDETIFDEKTGVDALPFKEWWPNMQRINPPKAGEAISGEMAWWWTFEAEKFNNDQGEQREFLPTDDVNIRITGDGGNLKAFYKLNQTATHIQILAYDFRYPELANGDTFEKAPWKIALSSAIDINGQVHKIAGGLEPYYFQVCRPSGLWIEKEKVIMLDQKPSTWTKADVYKQWT